MDAQPEIEFKTQSETIGKIAIALSKAQAKMSAAKRTADNPFFKSKYADLSAVWDAVREPLAEFELAVIQTPVEDSKGTAIVTTLAHSSGEWFRSKLYIAPKARDAQSIGSAITYARRYALSAITGVAPDDDDDGNKASGHGAPPAPATHAAPAETKRTPPEPPHEERVTFPVARAIEDITQMLSKMNGADADIMDSHLKTLTIYPDKKNPGQQKWVTVEGLANVGKFSPDWLKRIEKKVKEEYDKAFDAQGNPK